MKIECPNCYQHYELEKSDMDREVVCINCEQTFRVRDALVLDQPSAVRKPLLWVLIVMGVLIVVLAGLNLWNWKRLVEVRAGSVAPRPEASRMLPAENPAADLQTVIAPLYQTIKEMRGENERLAKQTAALEQTVADLTARFAKTEKQASASVGAERVAALEESANTQTIKVESLAAQQKLQDEYHKQLLKGLTDLRTELQTLNINDRMSALEKKVDEVDLGPLNRRFEKLEAIVNAMRIVH